MGEQIAADADAVRADMAEGVAAHAASLKKGPALAETLRGFEASLAALQQTAAGRGGRGGVATR